MARYDLHERAAEIIRDAGGELVGRTRLQKVTYLAQLAGYIPDFPFVYRHYGPFSQELAEAMDIAAGLRLVKEEEKSTSWGSWYSIYTLGDDQRPPGIGDIRDDRKAQFITAAAKESAIELELAATAAFLYAVERIGQDGNGDPWDETARRKPDKADPERLEKAKAVYRRMCELPAPVPLPRIA